MNQNQRSYEEVNAQSNNPRWEPQKNMNTQGYPMMLEGYFKKERTAPGRNGAFKVIELATINPDGTVGNIYDISGGAVLEDKMGQVKIGTWVGIRYDGKVMSKSGGNSYNDWKVFQDHNAIPYQQVFGEAPVQRTVQSASTHNNVAQQNNNGNQQNNGFPNQANNFNQNAGNGQQQQNNNFQQNQQGNGNGFPHQNNGNGFPQQNNGNVGVSQQNNNSGFPQQNQGTPGNGFPQQNQGAAATNFPQQNNSAPANNFPQQNHGTGFPQQNNGAGNGFPQQNGNFPNQAGNNAPAGQNNNLSYKEDDLPF